MLLELQKFPIEHQKSVLRSYIRLYRSHNFAKLNSGPCSLNGPEGVAAVGESAAREHRAERLERGGVLFAPRAACCSTFDEVYLFFPRRFFDTHAGITIFRDLKHLLDYFISIDCQFKILSNSNGIQLLNFN